MSSTENRPSSSPNRGRSDTDNDSTKGVDDPTRPSGRKSEDVYDASVSTVVPSGQGLDGTPPTPASRCVKNAVEGEFVPDLPADGGAPLGTLALAPKWTIEPETMQKKLSPTRDSEAPMVTGGCSGKGNGSGRIWSTASGECKSGDPSTLSARAASPSMTPASIQRSLPPPLPSRSPLLLPPPPPPQQTPNVAGGAGSGGGGGGIGGTTALRDLDGCLVWYTDDSAAEADIESMASVASVDSREVGVMVKASAVRVKRLAAHFYFVHNYCR